MLLLISARKGEKKIFLSRCTTLSSLILEHAVHSSLPEPYYTSLAIRMAVIVVGPLSDGPKVCLPVGHSLFAK